MSEVRKIADQLKRAFESGAWHGPSVREVLDGLTGDQALARPLPNAHNIWEITLHIAAWEDAVRRRLQGEKVELGEAEDWSRTGETSPAAWAACLANLEHSSTTSITRPDCRAPQGGGACDPLDNAHNREQPPRALGARPWSPAAAPAEQVPRAPRGAR